MEGLFAFLFKYRPVVFQEGDFGWSAGRFLPLALGLFLLGAVVLTTYRSVGGRANRTDRIVLASLRTALFLGVLFCLLRPTLTLERVVPQRNFVGVLVDDSRSMGLDEGEDVPGRGDVAARALSGDEGSLLHGLSERFAVRLFRFSDIAHRMDSLAELSFSGTQTDLGGALNYAASELEGVPLSGLVVLTDGAHNTGEELEEALVPIKAAGVPVFPVGLGREAQAQDIQVGRVETPARALRGSALVVDVVLTHAGFTGRTVPLIVEDDGRVVNTQDVELGQAGEPTTVRVRFEVADAGPRIFRFRVPPQPGETLEENNGRDALIQVDDRVQKILYFEGQPRPEVAMLRRALTGDRDLQLVVVNRTAENKFLRLSVDHEEELLAGFPRTREELFQYRGLVLGNVEASFFTHDQLQMIADFAGDRGGGVLFLGGHSALAEGGYAGTAVAEALPVELDADRESPDPPLLVDLSPRPTRAGLSHPVLQLAADERSSRELWEELPGLSSFNPVTQLKPGATDLLRAETETELGDVVLLAHHRYGRGKVIVFPVNDSWKWQMRRPLEDMSHERFWRQLLRWLVDGARETVQSSAAVDLVEPGETVSLRALVNDSTYLGVNGAEVAATVTAPDGTEAVVPMEWRVDTDGEYQGTFTPSGDGLFTVDVGAARGEESVGEARTYVRAAPSDREFFDAGMKASVLRRLADDTGGRFYTAETLATLPEDIEVTGAGVTLTEERELWDMPAVFLTLLALLAAEWAYRRSRELV